MHIEINLFFPSHEEISRLRIQIEPEVPATEQPESKLNIIFVWDTF